MIVPRRGWFDWRLKQLWKSRYLVWLFVWRDFVSVYKQTVLGPAWHLLRPLLTTVVFTLVFGRIISLSTDGTPPFLFYLTGTVAWSYFASSLDQTAKTFSNNLALFEKVYFHRLAIPVSIVLSNLVSFGIQFLIVIAAIVIYSLDGYTVQVNSAVLLMPVLIAMLAGFSLAGGVLIAALTARYRDLGYLVTFGVQLLMYLTPVIYPLSAVPAGYDWLAKINPLTPVLETFRYGLLGAGSVTAAGLIGSGVLLIAMLVVGLAIFNRVEQTFIDTV